MMKLKNVENGKDCLFRKSIKYAGMLGLIINLSGCVSSANEKLSKSELQAQREIRSRGYSVSSYGLNRAASENNSDILNLFEQSGIPKSDFSMALLYAVNKKNNAAVKLLLGKGADPNYNVYAGTAMNMAVNSGDYSNVESLISHGGDVNLVSVQDKTTPLFNAALSNKSDIAGLLIARGADVNYVNSITGDSVLIVAAKRGSEPVLKLIIESGSDPNYEDENGFTALDWAVFNKHFKCAEILLSNKASMYRKNGDCRRSVLFAFENSNLSLLNAMISNGLSPNSIAGNRMPLIVWCAKKGLLQGVEFLEKNGADLQARGADGMTALDYADLKQNRDSKSIEQSLMAKIKDVDSYTIEQFRKDNNIESYE